MTNSINLTLPKWTQMLVSGVPVTVEQAKEIIFRTDDFVYTAQGGNDHEFQDSYAKLAGLNRFEKYSMDEFHFQYMIKSKINFLETSYVRNNWGASCYIYGAHGWCAPDGTISFVDNVGTWPSAEEILNDWELIASAFPFLDLNVTLMNGEHCEENIQPVFNIRVVNGVATIKSADFTVHNIDSSAMRKIRTGEEIFVNFSYSDFTCERGLPEEWYAEFAERIRDIANSITDSDVKFRERAI